MSSILVGFVLLHPARPEAPLTRTKWICQLATVHICRLPFEDGNSHARLLGASVGDDRDAAFRFVRRMAHANANANFQDKTD